MPDTCSNCGRPLRPALRGFCPRCVTTPAQRERLARSPDAISNEGPVGRALDLLGWTVLAACVLVGFVLVWSWLGFAWALGGLIAVSVLAVLGFLGGG